MKATSKFLEPAEKSIRWADEAVAQLKDAISTYGKGDIGRFFFDLDPKSSENIYKFKVENVIPEDIEKFAFSTLSNTKNSFDQCSFNAALALNVNLVGNTYFPWSNGPSDMEGRLRRAKMPEVLWDIFAEQEPYKRSDAYAGGNDIFRGLATLANTKHTIGLTVSGRVARCDYPTVTSRGPNASVTLVPTIWDTEKQEIELIRCTGETYIYPDCEIACEIVINETCLSKSVNAIGALSGFLDRAKSFHKSMLIKCELLRGL